MIHPLQCRCGTLKGNVSHPEAVNRCICYCRDCQSFAHFLGRAAEILDKQGGTDVVQTRPANVTFTQGREALACMRLSGKGLLRWYAACCNTPIGNTLGDYRVSFVGLVHSCLEGGGTPLDDSFGPVRARVHTESAKGAVASSAIGMVGVIIRFIAIVAGARIGGSYRRTPFFSARGIPVAAPKVLDRGERARLLSAVDGA